MELILSFVNPLGNTVFQSARMHGWFVCKDLASHGS